MQTWESWGHCPRRKSICQFRGPLSADLKAEVAACQKCPHRQWFAACGQGLASAWSHSERSAPDVIMLRCWWVHSLKTFGLGPTSAWHPGNTSLAEPFSSGELEELSMDVKLTDKALTEFDKKLKFIKTAFNTSRERKKNLSKEVSEPKGWLSVWRRKSSAEKPPC